MVYTEAAIHMLKYLQSKEEGIDSELENKIKRLFGLVLVYTIV